VWRPWGRPFLWVPSCALKSLCSCVLLEERPRTRYTLQDQYKEDTMATIGQTIRTIQKVLTPDLLRKPYKDEAKRHAVAGHCYVASEALFHTLGGKSAGLKAYTARDWRGKSHWWLQDTRGKIWDPTEAQYTAFGKRPPYETGRGCGFLTKQPSRRAQQVLDRVGLRSRHCS
jgi:hypothetical protein